MRVPQHLVDRRREELRSLIRRDGFLPVTEICKRLGVSEATARRDLAAVEAGGHITRTYGGALADYNSAFASHDVRSGRARSAKSRIAERALALVPRRGTIFLDAGTTLQALARALARKRDLGGLVVVTNSLAVASVLGGAAGVTLHVVGGTFLGHQAALMGSRAVKSLAEWSFDAAFLGSMGLDAAGISNSHASIAGFQQAVLQHSKKSYFCLDASKLGKSSPHRVTDLAGFTALISDVSPRQLAAQGIDLPAAKLLRT